MEDSRAHVPSSCDLPRPRRPRGLHPRRNADVGDPDVDHHGFVVQIFGLVGDSVSNARALLEMNDRLRWTGERLRKDLEGATADMTPPLSPEAGKGYFEIIEGPIGPMTDVETVARNTNDQPTSWPTPRSATTTTSHAHGPEPGRAVRGPDVCHENNSSSASQNDYVQQESVQSELAEVSWFVRGTTLYRRVRLIKPELDWDLTNDSTGTESLSYALLYGSLLLAASPPIGHSTTTSTCRFGWKDMIRPTQPSRQIGVGPQYAGRSHEAREPVRPPAGNLRHAAHEPG